MKINPNSFFILPDKSIIYYNHFTDRPNKLEYYPTKTKTVGIYNIEKESWFGSKNYHQLLIKGTNDFIIREFDKTNTVNLDNIIDDISTGKPLLFYRATKAGMGLRKGHIHPKFGKKFESRYIMFSKIGDKDYQMDWYGDSKPDIEDPYLPNNKFDGELKIRVLSELGDDEKKQFELFVTKNKLSDHLVMNNDEFLSYLKEINLLKSTATNIDFIELLDYLKNDFSQENKELSFDELTKLLQKTNLVHGDENVKINTQLGLPIPNEAYYPMDLLREDPQFKNFEIKVKIPGQVGERFNETNLPVKYEQCGADNCFSQDIAVNEDIYGIRFSNKLLVFNELYKTNYIVDFLKEFLINAILYFVSSKINSNNIASIQKIVSLGFYKINVKDEPKKYDNVCFIPYLITKTHNEDNIVDLLNYFDKELIRLNDKLLIKRIVSNILIQIYNFYQVMYNLVNFTHRDFKLNNMLYDKNKDKVYIMDFGYTRININLHNQGINRKYDIGSSSFKLFPHMENSIDFDTLYYWLINPFDDPNPIHQQEEERKQSAEYNEAIKELFQGRIDPKYLTLLFLPSPDIIPVKYGKTKRTEINLEDVKNRNVVLESLQELKAVLINNELYPREMIIGSTEDLKSDILKLLQPPMQLQNEVALNQAPNSTVGGYRKNKSRRNTTKKGKHTQKGKHTHKGKHTRKTRQNKKKYLNKQKTNKRTHKLNKRTTKNKLNK